MTAPKLTAAQRAALEIVAEAISPYTCTTLPSKKGLHPLLIELCTLGFVTRVMNQTASRWAITPAGRAALEAK